MFRSLFFFCNTVNYRWRFFLSFLVRARGADSLNRISFSSRTAPRIFPDRSQMLAADVRCRAVGLLPRRVKLLPRRVENGPSRYVIDRVDIPLFVFAPLQSDDHNTIVSVRYIQDLNCFRQSEPTLLLNLKVQNGTTRPWYLNLHHALLANRHGLANGHIVQAHGLPVV